MQVDKEPTECKYLLFLDYILSGLMLCLVPDVPATLVMALLHKQQLHLYDQNLLIATMTRVRAGKFQLLESIPIGSNRIPWLTVELTQNIALARACADFVFNNGFMQVTTGFVDPEGNFCNCLDSGNVDRLSNVEVDDLVDNIEDNSAVNMTVECLNNSVGGLFCVQFDNTVKEIHNVATNNARTNNKEATPWSASCNIDYACVQLLLKQAQYVPMPLILQVLLSINTLMSSKANVQQGQEWCYKIVNYNNEDTTCRLAVICEENKECYECDVVAWLPSPGHVQDIMNRIWYTFTLLFSNAIMLNHQPLHRVLKAQQTPPHMDVPVDP
jgi:hypothetical protein